MTRRKPITSLAGAAAIPLAAVTVAAGTATASPPSAPANKTIATTAQTTTIRVANSSVGRLLVNSTGHTLYLFKADTGMKSACSGECATAWPPLLATGKPIAGAGLTASRLGTIGRSGGKRQVTYNGHPLYLFIKDKRPGDITGQGVLAFGAAWFVVSPSGNQVSKRPTNHGSAASTSRPPANAIPQNNGGDGDSDNNGSPSDDDGNL